MVFTISLWQARSSTWFVIVTEYSFCSFVKLICFRRTSRVYPILLLGLFQRPTSMQRTTESLPS